MDKRWIRFLESTKALDDRAKVKLSLVLAGVKPATYVKFKVSANNLHDKHRFEEMLKDVGVVFEFSTPKAYEEIVKVKTGHVRWSLKGTWYGYDIFASEKERQLFHEYKTLALREKMSDADNLAGELYGYPKCCMAHYLKEQNTRWLKSKYSYFQYFSERQDKSQRFPWVSHTPCKTSCKFSAKLNASYESVVKKTLPKFYARFSKKQLVSARCVIDSQADIYEDDELERSVWLEKNGHQYQCVSTKKVLKHYVAFSFLHKNSFEIGTLLDVKLQIQYGLPVVLKYKVSGFWPQVLHDRSLMKSHHVAIE